MLLNLLIKILLFIILYVILKKQEYATMKFCPLFVLYYHEKVQKSREKDLLQLVVKWLYIVISTILH